jgi:ankyrin repeat protein
MRMSNSRRKPTKRQLLHNKRQEVICELSDCIAAGDVSGVEAVLKTSSMTFTHSAVLRSEDLKNALVLHRVIDWYERECKHTSVSQSTITFVSSSSPDILATDMMKVLLSDSRVDSACLAQIHGFSKSTVLARAATLGLVSIVELLLADSRMEKALIHHVSEFGSTVLTHAAGAGHTSVVKALLADVRVDKTLIHHADACGWTLLSRTAFAGYTSIMELLLTDVRVDKTMIDYADHDGRNAMMRAIVPGHHAVVAMLLADPRVDTITIEHVDAYGDTGLSLAMQCDESSIAKLLIQYPKTSFSSIVQAADRTRWLTPFIAAVINSELTRRQMCVIYPANNPELRPVVNDETLECSLVTSFFNSPLFDVNVLRIIREYAFAKIAVPKSPLL